MVFLTNEQTKQPLVDFLLETSYINLFQDMSKDYGHLKNSVDYHNCVVKRHIMKSEDDVDANGFAGIRKYADLLNSSSLNSAVEPAPCVATLVIKPNQQFNVVFRTLKAIANINPDGLSHKDPNYVCISKLEFLSEYSKKQIDLLYEHDIIFDEHITTRFKKNWKPGFKGMFEGHPVM